MTQWFDKNSFRPPLSDKLADWNALTLVSGEECIRGQDVLDIGPAFGLDAIMFARLARRYVIVDNADDVLKWIHELAYDDRLIGGEAEIVKANACDMHFENEFDLVLDFGSIDNSGDHLAAYACAARALRHHGLLVTTYANRLVLTNEYSGDEGEQRIYPEMLGLYLREQGMWVRNRYRENQPRALMIAQKGWEPYNGWQWVKTGECTCPGKPSSV